MLYPSIALVAYRFGNWIGDGYEVKYRCKKCTVLMNWWRVILVEIGGNKKKVPL